MSGAIMRSLAVLKVNWDAQGKDYIDNFVPFVVESIRLAPDPEVSLEVLSQDVGERFGLVLPLNALRQILSRAARAGYIRKSHGIFYRVAEKCRELGFSERLTVVQTTQKEMVGAFQKYATTEHGVEIGEDDAERVLVDFLRSESLDILYSKPTGDAFEVKDRTGERFLAGSFVVHAQNTEPAIFG